MDPQRASQPADRSDATASEQVDDPPQETESGWFRRTIDALTGRSRPEPEPETPASEGADAAAEEPAPKTITLTEEELAERERRAQQSGRDRALHELSQPRQKTPAERRAERASRRAEERTLLQANPWEAGDKRLADLDAEEAAEAAEEAAERQRESLAGVVQVADKAMLDPVLTRLPETEWRALLEENPDALTSFEGRSQLVTRALERIVETAEAGALEKAKTALRSTKTAEGRAFRKELLTELRGGLPEPELVQPGARSSGANGHTSENGFMNSAIRRSARAALLARDRDGDGDDLDDDD